MTDPEIVFHRGKKESPLYVFIHGMGMNATVWSEPSKARILGGTYLLSVLLDVPDNDLKTSFHDLKGLECHVLSWSQARPAGRIQIAVNELHEIIKKYRKYTENGIIFICHSRGGLIARKYLEEDTSLLRGLITLATPHHGTSLARLAVSVLPITSSLNSLLQSFSKKKIDSAVKRILGFLSSSGLKELLPDSGFFSRLKNNMSEEAFYISLGGTNPDLLKGVSVSLSRLITDILPDIILPEEMREEYGDGLVSAASSVLPYADEHLNFHLNHASILFDQEVRELILNRVKPFS